MNSQTETIFDRTRQKCSINGVWSQVGGHKLTLLLACLHDQNKRDFFGGPAFF